ncbi:hypothetical protein FQN51_000375 [Onygenales sp. PD_10]|nr:hypothetical protein FQN51_000375 [Onygenales sp. PD_10]
MESLQPMPKLRTVTEHLNTVESSNESTVNTLQQHADLLLHEHAIPKKAKDSFRHFSRCLRSTINAEPLEREAWEMKTAAAHEKYQQELLGHYPEAAVKLAPRLNTKNSTPGTKSNSDDNLDPSSAGKFDMSVYWQLCHASFSLCLSRLFNSTSAKNEGSLAADIAKWRQKANGGALWFLSRVIRDNSISFIPADRSLTAALLCRLSPKFPYVLAIINHVVVTQHQGLLVFCQYPMPAFTAELFTTLFDVDVGVIRASMTGHERAETVEDFTNNSGSLEQFLNVSFIYK